MITTKFLRNFKYSKSFLINSTNVLQKSFRKFGTSSSFHVKMYMEHENMHAYTIMANKGYAIAFNEEKTDTMLTQERFEQLLEFSNKRNPEQLFECFSIMGDYCATHKICISNKMFDSFIDELTDNIKKASDEQLKFLFYSLLKWPETESVRTRNFIEVWAALDDECYNRINTWSYDTALSFVALFYMLNLTRVSDFSKKSLNKLATKAKQLTPCQLVQCMFFVGVLRKPPFDMHNLEIKLNDIFYELTIDELAIVSMGFFKSKTPIRSMELIIKIINKVIDNSKDIHELSLAALLKVIRFSMKIPVNDKIYKLLDIMQNEIPRLSLMCNVHLALLGTATLTLHEDCLTKIAIKSINNISQCRLKDLERLVLTYGLFHFIPHTKDSFFQKVIDELRKPEREPEIEKHGRCFACCISYLGLLGLYPVDLMNKALNPEFLVKSYGKYFYNYGREVLTLHNTLEIFCSGTKINHLSDKVTKELAKRYTDYVPDENYNKQYNVTERMFLDVFSVLRELRGDDYVVADHILPHHQRGDIIVCNNPEGIAVPVRDIFNIKKFGLLKRPPDNNHWIVFVITGRNAIINNSNAPTGPFQAKLRELRALGFHPILLLWTVYSNMKSREEKYDYLNIMINELGIKNN